MGQELEGKVAIVTGGASGIGLASAELFAAEGAKVVIADLNEAQGAAAAERLGDAVLFRRADVASADDVQSLVDLAVERFGCLDIMFNNAGTPGAAFPHFLDDPLSDFHQIMGVNVLGVMLGTQRAARHMRQRGGVIINNTSIAGAVAGLALMTYRASKAAAIHFSKSAAIDLAQFGIRVNCLVPGHIRTPITNKPLASMSADVTARVEAATQPVWDANKPLKRQGVPEDVAQTALFLASDRAAHITGAVLPVDGGISIGDPVNHLEQLLEAQARAIAGAE